MLERWTQTCAPGREPHPSDESDICRAKWAFRSWALVDMAGVVRESMNEVPQLRAQSTEHLKSGVARK